MSAPATEGRASPHSVNPSAGDPIAERQGAAEPPTCGCSAPHGSGHAPSWRRALAAYRAKPPTCGSSTPHGSGHAPSWRRALAAYRAQPPTCGSSTPHGSGHAPSWRRALAAYRTSKGLAELLGDWPAYVFFRPLSLRMAPVLARLGVRASAVTGAAAGLALALPWAAIHAGPFAVAGLGAGFQLLDCLDGDVARARGQTSRRGDYFSMLVGQAYWALLLLAFGLLAAQAAQQPWIAGKTALLAPAAWSPLAEHDGPWGQAAWSPLADHDGPWGQAARPPWIAAHGAACGLGLGLLTVGGRLCREYVARQTGRAPLAAAQSRPSTWLGWARVLGSGLDNLYIAAIALGGITGTLPAMFTATAAYCVLLFCVVQKELLCGL